MRLILWLCLALFTLISFCYTIEFTCLPGFSSSSGVSLPKGDIYLEVGSKPINISCHLNPNHKYYKSGYRSDKLKFFVESNTSKHLESSIINDTTIFSEFNLSGEANIFHVHCSISLGKDFENYICTQRIIVGYRPMAPANFGCVSENWLNLICSWDVPFNTIETKYRLFIVGENKAHHFACDSTLNGGRVFYTCELGKKTTPAFHLNLRIYNFVLNVTNFLDYDVLTFRYNVDIYTIVRPGKAVAAEISCLNASSLRLSFDIPISLYFFPPGLTQLTFVRLAKHPKSEWDLRSSSFINFGSNFLDEIYFNHTAESKVVVILDNLYAFTEYFIKVHLLNNLSNRSIEALWSEPVILSAKTKAKKPILAPKMTMGSFEVLNHKNSRTIFIYWRQIPPHMKNGPLFTYNITRVYQDGILIPKRPVLITDAYAEFRNMSLYQNYSIFVTSENIEGVLEQNQSSILIPSADQLWHLQPRSFTQSDSSLFSRLKELVWFKTVRSNQVVSYTIFWRLSSFKRYRSFQCHDQLDWITINSKETSYNLSLPIHVHGVYQIAIAANTNSISSGMVWSSCTIIHNQTVGMIPSVWTDGLKVNSIIGKWRRRRQDCTDRFGDVDEITIQFCQIDSLFCLDSSIRSKTTRAIVETFVFDKLKPCTSYKFRISRRLNLEGDIDTDVLAKTRTETDCFYSAPVNLSITGATYFSLNFSWFPPLLTNGPINCYQLILKSKGVIIDSVLKSGTTSFAVFNSHLQPYTSYIFLVRACTVIENSTTCLEKCSFEWACIEAHTTSTQVLAPWIEHLNANEITLSWHLNGSGFDIGGLEVAFEILIIYPDSRNTTKLTTKLTNLAHLYRSMIISMDYINYSHISCSTFNASSKQTFYTSFRARAIIFDSVRNNSIAGRWSEPINYSSNCKSLVPWLLIIPIVWFLALAFICATLLFIRCCKAYRNNLKFFEFVERKLNDKYTLSVDTLSTEQTLAEYTQSNAAAAVDDSDYVYEEMAVNYNMTQTDIVVEVTSVKSNDTAEPPSNEALLSNESVNSCDDANLNNVSVAINFGSEDIFSLNYAECDDIFRSIPNQVHLTSPGYVINCLSESRDDKLSKCHHSVDNLVLNSLASTMTNSTSSNSSPRIDKGLLNKDENKSRYNVAPPTPTSYISVFQAQQMSSCKQKSLRFSDKTLPGGSYSMISAISTRSFDNISNSIDQLELS